MGARALIMGTIWRERWMASVDGLSRPERCYGLEYGAMELTPKPSCRDPRGLQLCVRRGAYVGADAPHVFFQVHREGQIL